MATAISRSTGRVIILAKWDRYSQSLSLLPPLTRSSPQVNLVAGGSGLTPHWQLVHAILSDETDKTLIKLIDM